MQAYSASSDVTPLLETLRELQAQQGQPEPELDGERRQRAITREDLHLVCYEYICS